jgi:hypothetical protein
MWYSSWECLWIRMWSLSVFSHPLDQRLVGSYNHEFTLCWEGVASSAVARKREVSSALSLLLELDVFPQHPDQSLVRELLNLMGSRNHK